MKSIEQLRESPMRYAIPWSMTLARPIFSEFGRRAAKNDKWGATAGWFAAAALTDFEGRPAEYLNAKSDLGAKADPIADGIMRAQALIALAQEMPVTAGIVFAAEAYNIKLNATLQKGREKPIVPMLAKIGSAAEFAGFGLAADGVRTKSIVRKTVGKAAMLLGAATRLYAYRREVKNIHG